MKNQLKILLINPFFFFFSQDRYDLEKVKNKTEFVEAPLGLGYLSAYIKKYFKNIDIEVYDANAMAISEIIKSNDVNMKHLFGLVETKIKTYRPDIIGISALFEFNGYIALKFIHLVKKAEKNIITIMGGAYASHSFNKAFKNKNLDFIIKGEGEEGFRQFIEYILNERNVKDVGSLIYRSNGGIKANSTVLVNNIDTIPRVDRSNFLMDLYASYSVRLANRHSKISYIPRLASILTSRGCPYKCAFCSTRLQWGPKIRYRKISDVMSEIKWLKDTYNINTFFFPDDNICTNSKHFIEFLKQLKKEKIKWLSGGFQVSAMTDEAINLCIESGLLYFPMSFESGANETLKKLKKPLNIKQSEDFVKRARLIDNNIYIFGSWITALPFETLEDIDKTHAFAKYLDLDWSSFYCYQPYPGTEIYQYCIDKGYIQENEENVKSPVALLNAISTENFSASEVVFKNYCANIDINFLNNRNLNGRGNFTQAYRDFVDIINNYPTHVFAHYALSNYFNNLGNKKKSRYFLMKARESSEVEKFYEPFIKHFNLTKELLE
ncbi:MAG: radical SAM protein [Thermodesulfobacteriota bacterium]